MSSAKITLAIIGRPNVGKSTLFNRLLGRRRALVHDLPGVTRDRLLEKARWIVQGKTVPVVLVDTGGLGEGKFEREISEQVDLALKEANVTLVLFDGEAGLINEDKDVLRKLQKAGIKSVIGVVNKVDDHVHESRINDFYELGLDSLLTISAEHGRGIEDLKEAVVAAVNPGQWESEILEKEDFEESSEEAQSDEDEALARIALVGRPNVGKSTTANALIGEDRMITSEIAGTTVDAVDSLVELDGEPFILMDTAGIRRKSKTEQGVEVLSVVQARKAIELANVAVLLIDGAEGVTDQDEKIGGLLDEAGCGVIIAVNKWDVGQNIKGFDQEKAAKHIREKMAYLRYAPIIFVSAKKKRGFEGLGELINEILNQRKTKVGTHELTEFARKESEVHNPDNAKFFMAHQSGRHPPTFVFHVNSPDKVPFSLRRHLSNAIRERWGFMGNPIRLLFIAGKNERRAKTPNELAVKKSKRWSKK